VWSNVSDAQRAAVTIQREVVQTTVPTLDDHTTRININLLQVKLHVNLVTKTKQHVRGTKQETECWTSPDKFATFLAES